MFPVTKITSKTTSNRLVFIASAPDTELGIPGAMKDIIGTVPMDDSTKADLVAPTLNAADFVLIDVEGGFGTVKRK